MSRLYKCTLPQGLSVHGFTDAQGLNSWPLPRHENGIWQPGDWKTAKGSLKPHFSGLHLAPEHMLVLWLREEIYLAEVGEDVQFSSDCIVARKGRLLKRLYLPNDECAKLALELAELAHDSFKALVFPWDIVRRLETGLEVAKEAYGNRKFHWQFQKSPDLGRVWQQIGEVVALCDTDQFSGFETNLNVAAAKAAAEAILKLQELDYSPFAQDNWRVVKSQTAFLMRAISGLVEDLLLRYGPRFDEKLVSPVVQPFLKSHPEYPLLHHAVRFEVSQYCNAEVLALLKEGVP